MENALDKEDVALLRKASSLDWAEIDPSILGTLFERGLDPDKRSQLGAHYTDRAKIDLLVNAVVVDPLLSEWGTVKQQIEADMDARAEIMRGEAKQDAKTAKALTAAAINEESRNTKSKLLKARESRRRKKAAFLSDAQGAYRGFLDRLRAFRVLDPACGSGNFLYVSLQALKDLEQRVAIEAEVLGLEPSLPLIGPEAVLGIEINSYAAELARVSVWIGHIQWARRNGYPAPENPVLRSLNTIECRDALLDKEGRATEWPEADAIVGNPPFLGDKMMIGRLGAEYTRKLRKAYHGSLPGGADLVCYWFEKARIQILAGAAKRVGLVATNSIRGGANRRVLEAIITSPGQSISEAWPDVEWINEGAAIRVSLVCFGRRLASPQKLDGVVVQVIHADLTGTQANLTHAAVLPSNQNVSFIGSMKKAAFDVSGNLAREWLLRPTNPNGKNNSDVLLPWMNGDDVTGRAADRWIIDFGNRSESEAAFFVEPFRHALVHVLPRRRQSGSSSEQKYWWRLARRAPAMLSAISGNTRIMATPRVAKHRLFVWLPVPLMPDGQLVVIARNDDTSFGILHSRFHEAWTLRLCTWLGVGNDPRYTPSTTFETFPFPEGLTPSMPAAAYAADPHAQRIAAAARALVEARDRWLNPPELVNSVPEVVPGFPDRLIPKNAAAAALLKKRTLTALYNMRGKPEGAWLDNLHRDLDAAVATAYGWPEGISEEDALARLLELNLARAAVQDEPAKAKADRNTAPAAKARTLKRVVFDTDESASQENPSKASTTEAPAPAHMAKRRKSPVPA